MRVRLVTLVTCLTLNATSAFAAPQSLAGLAWLAGSWQGEGSGMVVDSQFSQPAAGILLGQGRYTAGGALAFYEFELFKEEDGGVTLTPSPFGQPGVTFKAVTLEAGRAVFRNPDNAFPNEIEYRLLPDGSLYSRAEGDEGGEHKVYEYVQKKG